ncbi:outer membrane beta-barrel protein [Rubrolithibacter danxiaensis]|uniref:outer membrane beta-barrel protein n=1 Tax=Rubrolithibacter danxiaensis TaxID=3390805 RepID=UPI003BF7A2DB
MKTLKILMLILFTTLAVNTAMAQNNGSVGGKVVDEQQKPLDYATLNLLNAKDSSLVKTVLSEVTGDFKFQNIKNGEYLVSATTVGYKKAVSKPFKIEETNKNITLPAFQLQNESKTLGEVTVVAQKPFVERRADKLVVNVEGSSVSVGNTALEVLQKAPGVSVDKDDNISMNGKSSVLVMLDGKPTYMSNADLANMLRSMQSNEIQSIELITNPSAKYDAAGNGGIINIKTKRNKNMGFNGTLTAGTGYGRTTKFNGGTNLNFRKGKFNVFGNYNYGNNGNKSIFTLDRIVNNKGVITNFNQDNDWDARRYNNSYKVGVDFFVSKKTTLGVLANGYSNSVNQLSNSGTLVLDKSYIVGSSIDVDGRNKQRYANNAFNFNTKTTFDSLGRELSFDADYSKYNGEMNEFRDYFYTISNGSKKPSKYIHNFAPSDIEVKSAKLDYTHPINKTLKLEIGWKSSWVTTDNNLKFDTLQNNNWVSDAGRSNHFIYKENINAGYLNLNKEFKTTTVQVGLRAEHTNSNGNSITQNSIVEKDYIKFFPSVSVSQKINKDHQLGLTFSRRIDRPSYDNLNPFIYILDDYTYEQGNPYLNPQYTNSAELSYTFKGSFTAGLSYSKTKNVMTQITEQNDETNITYAQERNLNDQTVYSLNIYAPIPVQKWWNMNNNVQVFNMGFKSDLFGESLDVNQTVFQLNTDNQFTINKTTGAELSFWYMSPLRYGIFEIRNSPAVNIGIKKSFMNNKMNLKLNMNDIFNTRRNRGATTYANMNFNFMNKWESRVANLSLTYRFGNSNVKGARQRSTGLDSETNRMKN